MFTTNRSLDNDIELEASLVGYDGYVLSEHIELYSDDLSVENDKDNERIVPTRRETSVGDITLKKHSWNMLVFKR